MTLLLLGGTGDARRLATSMLAGFRGAVEALRAGGDGFATVDGQPIHLIYSVAGLVRLPEVDCEVVSGGFSQYGGLADFVANREIAGVIDATHPYAEQMTNTAAAVARQANIAYWRYQRPSWQPQDDDQWFEFGLEQDLLRGLDGYRSVFWTAGQLSDIAAYALQRLHRRRGLTTVLRTAARPQQTLPDGVHWLQATGPFTVSHERALFDDYQFDVLVSKNSGGSAVAAKLQVAREKGLPVFLQQRPALPSHINRFTNPVACLHAVWSWLQQKRAKNLGEFTYE